MSPPPDHPDDASTSPHVNTFRHASEKASSEANPLTDADAVLLRSAPNSTKNCNESVPGTITNDFESCPYNGEKQRVGVEGMVGSGERRDFAITPASFSQSGLPDLAPTHADASSNIQNKEGKNGLKTSTLSSELPPLSLISLQSNAEKNATHSPPQSAWTHRVSWANRPQRQLRCGSNRVSYQPFDS